MRELLIFKRENLVVEFLRLHKGKANAVTMQDIADFLRGNGFDLHTRSIDPLVKRISLERCLPVLHCAKGYFWANTQAEIRESITDFENRISLMRDYISHLDNFLIKSGGGE